MRTHLFSGDVEGDLLGDFLLEDMEDFDETSREAQQKRPCFFVLKL